MGRELELRKVTWASLGSVFHTGLPHKRIFKKKYSEGKFSLKTNALILCEIWGWNLGVGTEVAI